MLGGGALGLFRKHSFLSQEQSQSTLATDIEPSERQAMAGVAEDFMRQLNAPGLSLAVARDGRIVYEQSLGFTGHGSKERLTTSHLFRIASVSKPITSAAILRLMEQGRLQIEETVFGKRGILGTRYGGPTYGPGIEQITIDHLLTHTAGGWSNLENDPMFLNVGMDQAELISWTLKNQALRNPPGKVFAYSNFGYCILGRVIERITGQSYAEYVRSAILQPCGITDMRIGENTLQKRAGREVTYYGQGEGPYDEPYAINVRRMDSHGGWIATPGDLVRFAIHVDGFDHNRNILQPETIRKMATSTAANRHYARGWNVNEKGHWWHGGDLAGTTAVLVRTSSRFCWAALTNTRRGESAEAIDDMLWNLVRKVSAWRSALT
jgi:CubicO group peptidase (beta-lactamase class C family)